MATQVLSQVPSHFAQGAEAYSSDMFPAYTNYQTFPTNPPTGYLYDAEAHTVNYNPDGWPAQPGSIRRLSSRSPSAQQGRTPIRHKQSISRSRSVSKADALLVYATEQSFQPSHQQQHPANTSPLITQTTQSPSPSLFTSHTYTTMPSAPSFLQQPQSQQSQQQSSQTQPQYYGSSPQYSDISSQHETHSHPMSDYYHTGRQELQISPLNPTALGTGTTVYIPSSSQARAIQMPGLSTTSMNFTTMPRTLESTPGAIEVSSSRNKPQCWDHGCNGRQFSTFSNLLRHQREKSGTAAKARCPHCNTEFTRTTARNGHMYGGKCKGMSDTSRRSPGAGDDSIEHEDRH